MSVVDNHQGSFPAADHMAYAGFAMHVHLAEIFKLNSQTGLGFKSETGLSTCGHPVRFASVREILKWDAMVCTASRPQLTDSDFTMSSKLLFPPKGVRI